MKVVLSILAFISIFAMFCAKDQKERIPYTISFCMTVLGMIALSVLDWLVALWH